LTTMAIARNAVYKLK